MTPPRPDRADDAGSRLKPAAFVASFLDMLAAERGAAKNTLEAYRRDLEDHLDFLQTEGGHPLDADTEMLRDYLADLEARGLKASSSARRLSALRQFYKFLFAEGRRPDDPSTLLEGPRRGRPLPKIMSVADIDRLLASVRAAVDVPDLDPAQRLSRARLHCLLEVLYATGLRVSELVGLPKTAARAAPGRGVVGRPADRRHDLISIRGKGGRERLVP
jgi:integrase/recombinase XerD